MARSKLWAGRITLAIEVVWWLSLAAVAAGSVLLIVVATHAAGGGSVSLEFFFQLPARAYRISARQLSGASPQIGLTSGQLAFARPRLPFVLLSGLVLAIVAVAWLFILAQLRRLLAALRRGEPFVRENERRLWRIGLAVIGFEFAYALAVWGGGLYLKGTLIARGITLRSHFGLDVPVVVLGLVLLALAGAFRVGSELAEEQALTV